MKKTSTLIASRRKTMACPGRLSQWNQEVSTAFAHLSKPQCWGLALWSAGIALAGAAGLAQVSALLSAILEEQEQTVFQRLREWYLDQEQKTGQKRRELDVRTCFAPLLQWVVRLHRFHGEEKRRLALALDATSLRNRWTILAISVLVAGCAIPVAWKVLPAEQEGSWRPHWEALLNGIGPSVPRDWEVLVLADRGLYARWLWDGIVAWGWHPFLRINVGSKAREVGQESFEWLSHWVPAPGTCWQGPLECFAGKASRLLATVLMHWEPGYENAWIIVTDLPAHDAQIAWYRLRTWIEGGFKDFKRGFWGWHHSKMERASCVERLWLAMALAQLWCVSLGCQAEAQQEEVVRLHEPGSALPERHIAHTTRTRPAGQLPPRRLSCVVRGHLLLLAMQFQGKTFSIGILLAERWPETMISPQKTRVSKKKHQKTANQKDRQKRAKRRARERKRAQK
jgi:hypothetical protein